MLTQTVETKHKVWSTQCNRILQYNIILEIIERSDTRTIHAAAVTVYIVQPGCKQGSDFCMIADTWSVLGPMLLGAARSIASPASLPCTAVPHVQAQGLNLPLCRDTGQFQSCWTLKCRNSPPHRDLVHSNVSLSLSASRCWHIFCYDCSLDFYLNVAVSMQKGVFAYDIECGLFCLSWKLEISQCYVKIFEIEKFY
jgi:hypothetical protein